MVKIFLGNELITALECDVVDKPFLCALCDELSINYTEDDAGNIVLEPTLGNVTVVLRPLAAPDQTMKVLLDKLKEELERHGANVIIIPVTASDGQVYQYWQTNVFFAFNKKETTAKQAQIRLFYSFRKREESLHLIASLIKEMLHSNTPMSYKIAGQLEHLINLKYHFLLRNVNVPSVLMEFSESVFNKDSVNNISQWIIKGLNKYFKVIKSEKNDEIVSKLQILLQHLNDFIKLNKYIDEKETVDNTLEKHGTLAKPEAIISHIEDEKEKDQEVTLFTDMEHGQPVVVDNNDDNDSVKREPIAVELLENNDEHIEEIPDKAHEDKKTTDNIHITDKKSKISRISKSKILLNRAKVNKRKIPSRMKVVYSEKFTSPIIQNKRNPSYFLAPPGDGPVYVYQRKLSSHQTNQYALSPLTEYTPITGKHHYPPYGRNMIYSSMAAKELQKKEVFFSKDLNVSNDVTSSQNKGVFEQLKELKSVINQPFESENQESPPV